jgi:hypothetical protein
VLEGEMDENLGAEVLARANLRSERAVADGERLGAEADRQGIDDCTIGEIAGALRAGYGLAADPFAG